jgi:hypothetical protein
MPATVSVHCVLGRLSSSVLLKCLQVLRHLARRLAVDAISCMLGSLAVSFARTSSKRSRTTVWRRQQLSHHDKHIPQAHGGFPLLRQKIDARFSRLRRNIWVPNACGKGNLHAHTLNRA